MTKAKIKRLVKLLDKPIKSIDDVVEIGKIIQCINNDDRCFSKLIKYNLNLHEINVIMSIVG